MKLFKTIFACALFAALTLPAVAQTSPKTLTIPIITAGATSNSIAQVITCAKQQNVALQWTTTSTNINVRISSSVDNSAWNTNAYVIGFGSTSGTTTTITNLAVYGVPYLRIDSVLCTGTINATNTVKWAEKPDK